jgi:hypothetical protein
MALPGWALVLVGSAGWTTRRLPRVLSVLYLVAGAASLFVYLLPEMAGGVAALGVVVSTWQGIVLWKVGPGEMQVPGIKVSQPDQAESGAFDCQSIKAGAAQPAELRDLPFDILSYEQ